MNFIFHSVGKNNPKWRTHIFQRGRYTTNQIIYTYFHYTRFWALSIMHKKIAHLNYVVLFVIPYPAQQKISFLVGRLPRFIYTFPCFLNVFPRHFNVFPRLFHGHSMAHVFFGCVFLFETYTCCFFSGKNNTWNSQTSFLPLQFWSSINPGFYTL